MGDKHAICSPSGASGWMNCSGWEGNTGSSKYSREGTAAHDLAAKCLTQKLPAESFLDSKIIVEGQTFVVSQDMADHVQTYLDIVNSLQGDLFVEQRLSIEHITGEVGAAGTSDAVVLSHNDSELILADLKFGMGEVVYAEENEQLQIYALAAIELFSVIGTFKQVRLMIIQPRINNISEWTISVEDLLEFGKKARVAATKKLSGVLEYAPADKTCRWCSRKASCEALSEHIQQQIGAGFDVITDDDEIPLPNEATTEDDLSIKMKAAPLIEIWVKAIRAEVERRLLAGKTVDGFKLVEGKRGNRTWTDADDAEALLKSFRLKREEMYDFSLISPTAAEKLLKENPRRWSKVEELISRKGGKPSVAAMSDKRPALVMTDAQEGFDNLTNEEGE